MREAVIVEAVRTPVGRYGGALKDVRPDDLAESEEGRAGAGIVQQRQQLLDAPLHAAFKATRPQAARRRPEDARVEILLDVDAEGVHNH